MKRNFKSNKAYNKWRKQFLLGKDVNGKKLYPGDFVKIYMQAEVTKPHCSMIYWNALDGAFIESHPAHKWMDRIKIDEPRHRDLSRILRDQETYNTNELLRFRPIVTKISYTEYLKWFDETKAHYEEIYYNKDKNPVDYLIETLKLNNEKNEE